MTQLVTQVEHGYFFNKKRGVPLGKNVSNVRKVSNASGKKRYLNGSPKYPALSCNLDRGGYVANSVGKNRGG